MLLTCARGLRTMVTFRRLHHKLVRLSKVVPQKPLRKYEGYENLCIIAAGTKTHKTQAVSDGELNMSARSCGGSSSSLPGTPGGEGPANSVLRWAVSFENLLEDPCGVRYFTDFLMSEVSAENILFWQACEKFKKIPATSLNELKTSACSMFNMYLSESAPYSVNIDDSARIEEQDLEQPTPDMFTKAQAQIFKLMKMDSYRRFVRSPLYQSCTLSSVEGKSLPSLSSEANKGSQDNVTRSPYSDKKNKKSDFSSLRNKQQQKRGSWGEVEASAANVLVFRKDYQTSSKSNTAELGSLYRQIENGRSSLLSSVEGGHGRLGVEGGYCCVYLPDGSASLVPTRPGLDIREMLQSLCEKRRFPLKDVIIYLHGKDKQQPLSLDQDCAVLRDHQVSLELRVKFALEIAFTGKTVGIMVKSSKTLQDALSAVLQKHNLKVPEVQLSMVDSDDAVSMNTSVFKLANKTLRLDKAKGKDTNLSKATAHTTTEAFPGTDGDKMFRSQSHNDRNKAQPKPSKNRDMDGLLDMLSRAQCCRVDDQRGLLTKEQLEVPQFLQKSPEDGEVKPNATSSPPHPTDEDSPDCKDPRIPTAAEDVRETHV